MVLDAVEAGQINLVEVNGVPVLLFVDRRSFRGMESHFAPLGIEDAEDIVGPFVDDVQESAAGLAFHVDEAVACSGVYELLARILDEFRHARIDPGIGVNDLII